MSQTHVAQIWSAADYEKNGRFVADLAGEVLAWLDPQPGGRVLDLGCGDGALTEHIAAAGAQVVGIDGSAEMVEAAGARGLDARLGSGEALCFTQEFDAVFSNAALHWMLDQNAVLRGVRAALKPGGRFVAEMGGHGNIAAIRTALRAACLQLSIDAEAAGANVFFTPEEYRGLLDRHGFGVERMVLAPRPTLLPTGMDGWLRTFRRSLLERVPEARREALIGEVVELLRPVLCDRSGQWFADYVRLRFVAVAV